MAFLSVVDKERTSLENQSLIFTNSKRKVFIMTVGELFKNIMLLESSGSNHNVMPQALTRSINAGLSQESTQISIKKKNIFGA